MDTTILEQIGLTKSEIKVYFALLELGSSSVGDILKKSKVPNSKIYMLLDRLAQRGLITKSIKNNKQIFIVESPKRLLEYIEEKKQELDNEKEKINKILPMLLSKQNKKSENTVKIFEGKKGMYAAYQDIYDTLKDGGEMLYFGMEEEQYYKKWLVDFFKANRDKRLKSKIKARGIMPNIPFARKNFKSDKHTQVKYLDFPFATGVVIYKNKVGIIDWDEILVYQINSVSVANKYRTMFEKMWKKK